jgi:hypothetical protein
MTEAHQPETWSVDPTLRFGRIHVIESLNTGLRAAADNGSRRSSRRLQPAGP